MKIVPALALGLLLSNLATAQEAHARILVGALPDDATNRGGLHFFDAKKNTLTALTGLAAEHSPSSLAVDGIDPSIVYIGTYGRTRPDVAGLASIMKVRFTGTKITDVQVLQSGLDEDYLLSILPIGKDLFFLGRRSVGSIPKAGGPVTTWLNMPEVADPRGLATDGRILFAATDATTLVRIDLGDFRNQRILKVLTDRPGEEIQSLAIDRSADLLVATAHPRFGARLLRIDSRTGRQIKAIALPFIGARAVAQDPGTGRIYVTGGTSDQSPVSSVVAIKDDKVVAGPIGSLPHALPAIAVLRAHNSFQRGIACPDATGKRAAIGLHYRASTQQATYDVTLEFQPQRSALLYFGRELDGPMLELSHLGAPGCPWGLSATQTFAVVTDTAGRARWRFTGPKNISLHGSVLAYQWVVQAPNANAASFVTSRLLRVVVRD